jgi:membrane protein YqaA with SNARE-associated domain
VEALSATRYALAALLVVSVIDGSVFPIPPFALLIPMVLTAPKRWWSLALMGTVASLGGGLIGYYLGSFIHSGLAPPALVFAFIAVLLGALCVGPVAALVNALGRHLRQRALRGLSAAGCYLAALAIVVAVSWKLQRGLLAVNLDAPLNVDWLSLHVHGTIGHLLGDNFWVLSLLCSILPTPFKVVAIGSGMVSVPLGKFMLAAVIGRTVRFYVVAGFMALFGPRARKWLRV